MASSDTPSRQQSSSSSGQFNNSSLLPDGGDYLNEPLYHHAFKARALSMPDLTDSLALANFHRRETVEAEAAALASEYGMIPTQDEIRDGI